ncbi:MAG: hypothetical protein WCI72_03720 [archaeon]
MVVSLVAISTIMPVISFLFIFILIYALLVKTKVLGENNMISLFLSLIIASFFIVNVNLVEFTKMNISWFVVFIVCLFMILLMLSFVGKEASEFFVKNTKVAGVLVALVIIMFIVSSSYAFNWAINFDSAQSLFDKEWFGMVLLIIVAGIVSFVLTKKVKG